MIESVRAQGMRTPLRASHEDALREGDQAPPAPSPLGGPLRPLAAHPHQLGKGRAQHHLTHGARWPVEEVEGYVLDSKMIIARQVPPHSHANPAAAGHPGIT